jgi:flavin-dependent dehydrogenase
VWVCATTEWTLQRRRGHAGTNDAFAAMVKDTSALLAGRLDDAVGQSAARGITTCPNHLLEPVGPGWALVGDAGYHRDPITGHGISDAFRDAELLSVALDRALRAPESERAVLREFHCERDRLLREIFDITCELSDSPTRPRFTELQKELGQAIDRQADELARRPLHTATAA